jgi:hypothetical protein
MIFMTEFTTRYTLELKWFTGRMKILFIINYGCNIHYDLRPD